MNKASRIKLAKQLLHCARMVLDAAQFKKSKNIVAIDDYIDSQLSQELLYDKNKSLKRNNQHEKQWKMVAFIYDKFTSPVSKTRSKRYTDYDYSRGINYHHIIDGINPEIGKNIVYNINNRRLLSKICQKITNLDVKKQDIYNSMLFSPRETFIIQEILATIPKPKKDHMKDQEQQNLTPTPEFEKAFQKLITLQDASPRQFFGQLTAIFSQYIFSKQQFHNFKSLIIKYISEQYEKWKYKMPKMK